MKLAIKNTGRGIPPEHIDKVFERFCRIDASRTQENGGYGSGLAIAKSIVQPRHGQIWAESRAGIDTTFFVRCHVRVK